MAAVPQRTLNWLYSVLTRVRWHNFLCFHPLFPPGMILIMALVQDHHDSRQTYQDPNRTYYDVANVLAQYPSLSPRTDVYSESNHLLG